MAKLSRCLRWAGLAVVAGCARATPASAPLPCWHVSVRADHELSIEVRAKDAKAAETLAEAQLRQHPTDWSIETDVQAAESVAVRFGADPTKVCR